MCYALLTELQFLGGTESTNQTVINPTNTDEINFNLDKLL